jgi:hypothetical protein
MRKPTNSERLTASEWLLNQYAKNALLSIYDFTEARRMEKEEIMDAYAQGVADEAGEILDVTKDSQQYFENTYGN